MFEREIVKLHADQFNYRGIRRKGRLPLSHPVRFARRQIIVKRGS